MPRLLWALILMIATVAEAKTDARNLFLKSPLIFGIEIVSTFPQQPDADGLPRSWSQTVEARVLEVFRGKLKQKKGGTFKTRVTRYNGPIRSMPAEASGVFGLREPELKQHYVVFAKPAEGDAPKLMEGLSPSCNALLDYKTVESDLRLFLEAEKNPSAPFSRFVEALEKNVERLGYYYPDYLCERFPLFDPKLKGSVEELMSKVLESPRIGYEAQYSIYQCLGSVVTSSDDKFLSLRYILSTFRLARLSPNSDFRRNLISTFLPTYIGMTSGLPKRTAAEVFAGHEEDREQAKVFLQAHPDKREAKALLDWLEGRAG